MWRKKLQQYDKKLFYIRKLDGSIEIYRQSPFSHQRHYLVLTIQNQYPGNWIIDKLMLMDTQRQNLAGKVVENNKKIQSEKEDARITREIANMFDSGGSLFVN